MSVIQYGEYNLFSFSCDEWRIYVDMLTLLIRQVRVKKRIKRPNGCGPEKEVVLGRGGWRRRKIYNSTQFTYQTTQTQKVVNIKRRPGFLCMYKGLNSARRDTSWGEHTHIGLLALISQTPLGGRAFLQGGEPWFPPRQKDLSLSPAQCGTTTKSSLARLDTSRPLAGGKLEETRAMGGDHHGPRTLSSYSSHLSRQSRASKKLLSGLGATD